MRVLVVTNMYPTTEKAAFGVFVHDQVESLKKLGIELDVFFVDGRKSKLNYFSAYPRFWRQLRKGKYDLIHAHYVLTGLIARAQWRLPVVLTHHGIEVLESWQAPLSRLVTPHFDQVIVMSQEMEHKFGQENIHIIPCGVDLDRFRPFPKKQARAALGLPDDKPLVLWAGEHWRPEKRFDLVQKAISLLKEKDPSVDLVLLSGKPHSEVPMYMNACDVLLLVSNAEGSPMVVKEAMACNLPVVSTAVGDVTQVIGDVDGCYISTQDPRDIADKAGLVLDKRLRTRGQERMERMSLEGIARQIAQVYDQALGKSAKETISVAD